MNEAKGRQHNYCAARRKIAREMRERRNRDRKIKRDKRVLANAGKPRKLSPSDLRRATARSRGLVSALKRVAR